MFASRLLNILETVPSDVEYETCVFDLAEQDMTMKENKKSLNPFDSRNFRTEADGSKDESWNAKFPDDFSTDNENGIQDSPKTEDQNGISYHLNPEHESTDSKSPDSSAANTNPFLDKNVLECELPELVVCYKEANYHIVKDICVDEGMPVKDKVLIENCEDDDAKKENDDKLFTEEMTKLPSENSLVKDTVKQCDTEDSVQTSESNLGSISQAPADSLDGGSLVDSKLPIQEFGTRSFLRSFITTLDDDGDKITQLPDQIPSAKAVSEGPPAPSIETEAKEDTAQAKSLLYKSKVENGSITFNFKKPSHESGDVALDDHKGNIGNVHEQTLIVEDGHNSGDSSPNSQIKSSGRKDENSPEQLKSNNDELAFDGESSFAALGHVTYSGPIAYSGSLSLRSEASTGTSGRSFAFPVLPNEWNSSPVRMAKGDRRQFRKHKGWRSGLLCCRF